MNSNDLRKSPRRASAAARMGLFAPVLIAGALLFVSPGCSKDPEILDPTNVQVPPPPPTRKNDPGAAPPKGGGSPDVRPDFYTK